MQVNIETVHLLVYVKEGSILPIVIFIDHGFLVTPGKAPLTPAITTFTGRRIDRVKATGLHVEKDLLKNEPSLLVLLTSFVRPYVGPTHDLPASFARNVANRMQTSQQPTIFCFADNYVDGVVEQVRSTVLPVKRLADNVIVTRQMCTTDTTGVHLRTIQIDHGIIQTTSGLRRQVVRGRRRRMAA